MPLNTVQLHLQSILDQQPLPFQLGLLTAYIQPPNPGDGTNATAYVWGSRGSERRRTVPRADAGNLATGGDKTINHDCDVWLVWFGEADTPGAGVQFPVIVDATMAILRNTALIQGTQYVTDPVTGQTSQLLDIGERMTFEYAPVRATADQRWLRYDAQITVSVEEWFQA